MLFYSWFVTSKQIPQNIWTECNIWFYSILSRPEAKEQLQFVVDKIKPDWDLRADIVIS